MRRAAAVAAAALALFSLLAADLLLHGPVTGADARVSAALHAHVEPALTRALFLVTHVHSNTGIVVMSALVAVLLVWRRRRRMIPWLVVTVQGGQLLNAAVKEVFDRARPVWDGALVHLSTYSFPSGHAAGATVFWGFVCVLAWSWPANRAMRRALAVVAPLMVALTALSRVYLGAHYLSDVLAGVCEGVAWVALCLIASGRYGWHGRSYKP